MPTVSILLPVYNAVQDLPRAMSSLLTQTFTDFEIIAIDDGSSDGSGEMLEQYARSDGRIRVFHQENAGALGKVLNRAAELAKGKFLARQDADDASAPTRLEEQVHYLQEHPQTGLCGTWTWFVDTELGPLFSLELPDKQALLRKYMDKGKNPFVHGSVMLHAEIFQKVGGYRGSYAEDFDLWLRMSEITNIGMCTSLGYYYWRSVSGISTGAQLRQHALVRLILKLHSERIRSGNEVSDWESEYQGIENLPVTESNPIERQTSIQYSRGLQLLRQGRLDLARTELIKATSGQGQYSKKARRNLALFWASPALVFLYSILERQEPEHFARKLPAKTLLPATLGK